MTAQTRQLLAGLAAVAFVVGLYLGLAPIKVAALDGTLDCGSAFSPNDNLFAGDLVRAECDSKTNDRKTLSIAILVVAGGTFWVATSGLKRRTANPSEPSDPASSVTP